MLEKTYNSQQVEDGIYAAWRASGAFAPTVDEGKEPYTVMMPPPNATGQLHLGHAVMLALEDIFTRFARMNGRAALWLPGTDHAAIATENVVIGTLKKGGMRDPRKELGREGVLQKIHEFVESSQDIIRSQVAKMGSSCDWSREAYTMDAVRSACVQKVFKQMYEDGLIYRGHRIVNWDPVLQTNVSDDELEYKELKDPFYLFNYGPFVIGTVRPETKFADKYIVVHPDDNRYKQYKHLQTFEVEWINGPITATLIKDEVADPEMGTGAMTITPWHSVVDFELAKKYNLPMEQIIDFDGKLLPIAGEFAGMHITKARELIVQKLQAKGLVHTINAEYVHSVAVNSRGGGTIEPQVKEQWFIDVNKPVVQWKNTTMSLKQVMQDVVRSGDIKIIPERFEKTYFHWIDNLRDWCISRQIWWGHQIPVWYKGTELSVDPAVANDASWTQDPDTLDTWFSAGIWTFSTLVDEKAALDPNLSIADMLKCSPDFQRFHPTTILETGYDILFFWVARMIMMTTYATGQVPFKTVYLHGLIRDKNGQKMSKSKPETMIDPLDIIPKYGADALRLSMIVGQSPGNDSRLYEEKIAGYRNFINKLWNASRYVLMKCDEAGIDPHKVSNTRILEYSNIRSELSLADKALLHALNELTNDVTKGIAEYRLSEVGERLYSFTWEYFCDWYLELSKGETNPEVLVFALRRLLILLHPYCPFVTEELWSACKPVDAPMLIMQPWPTTNAALNDTESFTELQQIIDVVTAIRSTRSAQEIEPAKKLTVSLGTGMTELFTEQTQHICTLARLEHLYIEPTGIIVENAASTFLPGVEVHVHLEGLLDLDAERKKLTSEKQKLEGFIKGLNAKLSNKQFIGSAPEAVVQLERDKLASNTEKLQKIEERLQQITQ